MKVVSRIDLVASHAFRPNGFGEKYMTPVTRLSRQAGVGLVEIMVALAIGAFMMAGIVSLFVWVSQTRVELDKTSEQIENGRYAIQVLSDDLRLAGFYGSSQVIASTYAVPDPCSTAATLSDLGLQYDTATASATLPVPVSGYKSGALLPTCLTNSVSGGESLVIHRVGTTSIVATSASSGTPYVQMSACQSDSQPMLFGKGAASIFTLRQKDCATVSTVWPYAVHTYYVSACDICSPNDGVPTLKMAELVGGNIQVTPLVEGIEDIHFEYGLDLDGNGAPDCFSDDPTQDAAPVATGCSVGWSAVDAENWANVTAVRVYLLARSIEPTPSWTDTRTYDLGRTSRSGPFNDHFKRQVYSTVVPMPNVGGLRE